MFILQHLPCKEKLHQQNFIMLSLKTQKWQQHAGTENSEVRILEIKPHVCTPLRTLTCCVPSMDLCSSPTRTMTSSRVVQKANTGTSLSQYEACVVCLTALAQLSPLISLWRSQVFLRTLTVSPQRVTQSDTGKVYGASKCVNYSSFIHLGKWINI